MKNQSIFLLFGLLLSSVFAYEHYCSAYITQDYCIAQDCKFTPIPDIKYKICGSKCNAHSSMQDCANDDFCMLLKGDCFFPFDCPSGNASQEACFKISPNCTWISGQFDVCTPNPAGPCSTYSTPTDCFNDANCSYTSTDGCTVNANICTFTPPCVANYCVQTTFEGQCTNPVCKSQDPYNCDHYCNNQPPFYCLGKQLGCKDIEEKDCNNSPNYCNLNLIGDCSPKSFGSAFLSRV